MITNFAKNPGKFEGYGTSNICQSFLMSLTGNLSVECANIMGVWMLCVRLISTYFSSLKKFFINGAWQKVRICAKGGDYVNTHALVVIINFLFVHRQITSIIHSYQINLLNWAFFLEKISIFHMNFSFFRIQLSIWISTGFQPKFSWFM